MEFDFLPNLPKSDLDDRAYKTLVEECILRIPAYCPEWTNYNPSDPGITLIELFAWLTDQMLLRFNQIPRRNYIAFLELLGIRLNPPTSARVDLTFYLTTALPSPYLIEAGTEVAAPRTGNEEAIVFTTERHLVIGNPTILHFLKEAQVGQIPTNLDDCFNSAWSLDEGIWTCREQTMLFAEQPQPGNCFYLVLEGSEPLEGNVLAINFKGEAATTTGINPSRPPRLWEAWNGEAWQPVLNQESDDGTRGFSFEDPNRKNYDISQGADIILHTPLTWASVSFQNYEGRWLRCVYIKPSDWQPGYLYSPRITGLSVHSLGGTVSANHCAVTKSEFLGTSNGKPGQVFQLKDRPVLNRQPGEYIEVTPPGELPQQWQEVQDFSQSHADSFHYILESQTGIVQFGPLIQESTQLKQQTEWRTRQAFLARSQRDGSGNDAALSENSLAELNPREQLERQYGKIPPRGSEIRMVSYRSGGGSKGNIQAGKVTQMRASIPYVQSVINHRSAQGGSDPESLNEAVLRVPQILKTRNRAVVPEDFEVLAIEAGAGKICRAHCLPLMSKRDAGKVYLLLVPQVELATNISSPKQGINPEEHLMLDLPLKQQVEAYLNERKIIGVQVLLQEPEYIRVSIQAEVALEPQYNHAKAQGEVLSQIRRALYRFLNPVTGGVDGQGWPLGQSLYTSDVIAVCQKITGIRHLGIVRLFELRKQNLQWVRFPVTEAGIDPGSTGLICSWEDEVNPGLGHTITLM
jgi:predicted phage baseplate assembly protein